jgi:hypothetical protein
MQKIETSKQIDGLYNRIASEVLIHHTCQFFIKKSDGLKPYGSGVFVLNHDTHFIVTASHVVEVLDNKGTDLYIQIALDEYINVGGTIKRTTVNNKKAIDLAYIKLDEQLIPELTNIYNFLTIDKIRNHSSLHVGGANYCVIGFPDNSFNNEGGISKPAAHVYITLPTNDKPYKYYNLNKDVWIILKMTGKSQDVVTKKKQPMHTHFYGLSGCGLWLMMPNVYENSCDYRLIGIMTEYKKDKYFCLIGNKIHVLLQALTVFENMKFRTINTNN